MNAEPAFREQIVLTIDDQSKVDLVMELLSHFDLVRARRERLLPPLEIDYTATPLPTEPKEGFLDSYGAWAGRDDVVEADELRKQWQRDLSSLD